MKKRPLLLTATIVVLFLLALTLRPLIARNDLIAVCDEWPPYTYISNGTVTGFSIEVVDHVFSRMKIRHEPITAFPWKRALEIFTTNHADALLTANWTRDREAFARYPAEPLINSPWILWTLGSSIDSLDALKGKRIGVVSGYSYTQDFWDFIQLYCYVEEVHSDMLNFKKLQIGRLDAVAAELGNGLNIINTLHAQDIRPNMNVIIKSDGLFIIFNRTSISEDFVHAFSEELARFKATDTYKTITNRYFAIPPAK